MSKHLTEKIYVRQIHVEAEHVGDLLSVDVFGPLPLKPGGVIALFVALERLSEYIVTGNALFEH